MLHGARVDRPRAPVVPSLSNTVPYRFSTELVFSALQNSFYYCTKFKGYVLKEGKCLASRARPAHYDGAAMTFTGFYPLGGSQVAGVKPP